jgi:hypothetical protein
MYGKTINFYLMDYQMETENELNKRETWKGTNFSKLKHA